MDYLAGSTSNTVDIGIYDDTGLPVTGLVAATFPTLTYSLAGANADVNLSLSDLALITTVYTSGGVKERGGGKYRLDVPNGAFTTGGAVTIRGEASGKRVVCEVLHVVAYNPQDAVHLGLSSLPNVAIGAPNALIVNGANDTSAAVTLKGISFTTNLTIAGSLTVTGTTTLTGAVTLGSSLTVTGAVAFSSTFAITGAFTAGGTAITRTTDISTAAQLTTALLTGTTSSDYATANSLGKYVQDMSLLSKADQYTNKLTTPWSLVYIQSGTGAPGTGTALLTKRLFDVNGANITATSKTVGQAIQ